MKMNKNTLIMYILFGVTGLIGIIFFTLPSIIKKPSNTKELPDFALGFVEKDDFEFQKYSPKRNFTIKELQQRFDKRIYIGIAGIIVLFGASIYAGHLIRKKQKKHYTKNEINEEK